MNDEELCARVRESMFRQCHMRGYAAPAFCYYKRWGVKNKGQGRGAVIPLRFSRSGDAEIERRYATHYVDEKRIAQLKTMQVAAAEDRAALNVPEALSSQSPGQ